MANSNGLRNKFIFWGVSTLITVSCWGLWNHVSGQIDSLETDLGKVEASDSLKAAEHAKLEMHEGVRLVLEEKERRYIRDSAATIRFREDAIQSRVEIKEAIGDLTEWLKDNTNRDSVNGKP